MPAREEEPKWLTVGQVIGFHHMLIDEYRGQHGIRDRELLESALDRPRNKHHYEDASLWELAAAYAYGLVKNHAFHDGNKRVAATAIAVFLDLNGAYFRVDERELVLMIEGAAKGEVPEDRLANWIAENAKIRAA